MPIRRVIGLTLLILATVAVVASRWQGPPAEADVAQRLLRQRLEREARNAGGSVAPAAPAEDFAIAVAAGIPVPDSLVVTPVPEGGYWFVGKSRDGGGVEIPFPPGRNARLPDLDQQPVRPNPGYVGPDQCRECHRQIHTSFCQTAHFRTSSRATPENSRGVFEGPGSVMATRESGLAIKMIRDEEDFFQVVRFHDWGVRVPMDLIFGSSRMAQTFLYWHDDRLYQCNSTYLVDGNRWINSPGYVDGDAAYARPITPRCVDCHTTYFDLRGEPNAYTPGSMILGVTCERCHGPGEAHVKYHRANPLSDQPAAIVRPATLERMAQIQICGQCHGGSTTFTDAPFSYRPGDDLHDHYSEPTDRGELNSVHTSNQLSRLAKSKCFTETEMTCVTCHNPHQSERGKTTLFSRRCIECHAANACGVHDDLGDRIADNCIDCHMPSRSGNQLRLDSLEGAVFPALRDHFIRTDHDWADQIRQSQFASQAESNGPPDRTRPGAGDNVVPEDVSAE